MLRRSKYCRRVFGSLILSRWILQVANRRSHFCSIRFKRLNFLFSLNQLGSVRFSSRLANGFGSSPAHCRCLSLNIAPSAGTPVLKLCTSEITGHLQLGAPENFRYLRESGCVSVPGLDDRKDFSEVEEVRPFIVIFSWIFGFGDFVGFSAFHLFPPFPLFSFLYLSSISFLFFSSFVRLLDGGK